MVMDGIQALWLTLYVQMNYTTALYYLNGLKIFWLEVHRLKVFHLPVKTLFKRDQNGKFPPENFPLIR
jgi:hypothetical protein